MKTNFIAAFLYLLSAECDWNIQHMKGEFSSKYKNAIERAPLQSLLILTEYDLRII